MITTPVDAVVRGRRADGRQAGNDERDEGGPMDRLRASLDDFCRAQAAAVSSTSAAT
jgi:hypothetical protein